MIKYIFFIATFLVFNCCTSFSAGKKAVRIDTEEDPMPAGDSTAVIMDCDGKPHVGFAYCRVREGDLTGQGLVFIVPPANCSSRKQCVYIEVWNKSTLVWSTAVPKGQTSTVVTWKQLTGRTEFLLGDRGMWTVNQKVYFDDANGREVESRAQGDIVLRVFKKTYTPLHNSQADTNFAWSFTDGKYQYKMTSSLRAYVGI